MPRRLREDYPGAWQHVYNRGVAKRTILENDRDARMFLSLLARLVRAGQWEVHAIALMHTHFHLLVRSPRGELPRAMHRLLDGYARWFNRARRRDGPLFRGRYGNRVVESDAHWTAVVHYIHENPVSAGIFSRPEEFRYSSAWHLTRPKGPPWLDRSLYEEIAAIGRARTVAPGGLRGLQWMVGRRLHRGTDALDDPLEELAGAPPDRVRHWMVRKAALADGTRPGWILVSPGTVEEVMEGQRLGNGPASEPGGEETLGILEAGFLRYFCGLSLEEAALRLSVSPGTVRNRTGGFARRFKEEPEFVDTAARLLGDCLRRDFPATAGAGGGSVWRPGIPFRATPVEPPSGGVGSSGLPGVRGTAP